MSNVLQFPTLEKLFVTKDCTPENLKRSHESYQLGYNAFLRGLTRRRPSDKAEVFCRNSWLSGWDDAQRANDPAAA